MTILAYLDPGSSSMILQMLLGGIAAIGVALKLYWRRFLRLLRIRKEDPEVGLNRPAKANAAAATTTDTAAAEPVETTKR